MAPSQQPPLPIDVPSYTSQTQHLSTAEHGALILLYMAYWTNRGPILNSPRNLSRITKSAEVGATTWKDIRENVLKFFDEDHGYLRCPWIDEAISSSNKIRKAQQQGARQTNLSRWGSDSDSESHGEELCKTLGQKVFDEQFWPLYPKKIDRKGCRRTFSRIVDKDKVQPEKILQGLRWWMTHEQWTRDHGKFIPNPQTWLNQSRWEAQSNFTSPIPLTSERGVVIMGRRYTAVQGPTRENFETDEDYRTAIEKYRLWCSKG